MVALDKGKAKRSKSPQEALSSTCYFLLMLILQSNLPENKSIAFALKQIYSINR
jgi:hypothetical protein